MNPSILSIDMDGSRVRIVHSSGRIRIEPAALHLRATGATYSLHVRALRSGVYLRDVSPEHAAILSGMGVEAPVKAKPSHGWLRGTFQIRHAKGLVQSVCGAVRGRIGLHREESGRWSLTDLPSGLAIEYFSRQGEARRKADEIEFDPAVLAKI